MLRIGGIFWCVRLQDFLCRTLGHRWYATTSFWDPDIYGRCSRCGTWRSK